MFPLSCFRLELSKSNSSTRDPSTTTTRVSSAWAASINIFLDIRIISAARAGLEVQAQPAVGGKGARADRGGAAKRVPGGLRPNWGFSTPAHPFEVLASPGGAARAHGPTPE